jgi:uncharacterized protein YyaL (SSP411 family)
VVAPGFVDETAGSIPLLENRPLLDGRATAYVCQNYTCRQPVNNIESLAAELD